MIFPKRQKFLPSAAGFGLAWISNGITPRCFLWRGDRVVVAEKMARQRRRIRLPGRFGCHCWRLIDGRLADFLENTGEMVKLLHRVFG